MWLLVCTYHHFSLFAHLQHTYIQSYSWIGLPMYKKNVELSGWCCCPPLFLETVGKVCSETTFSVIPRYFKRERTSSSPYLFTSQSLWYKRIKPVSSRERKTWVLSLLTYLLWSGGTGSSSRRAQHVVTI